MRGRELVMARDVARLGAHRELELANSDRHDGVASVISRAVLRTDRLVLRSWRDEDVEPFAAMGQDPDVMAHFPALRSRDDTAAAIARQRAHEAREGFCLWAVEVVATGAFIGFCGLHRPGFMPVVEIGWRLARAHWGNGYATEAGRIALAHGFETLALDEIVAFVLPANARSRAVCERLGMHRDPGGDFAHPMIAPGTRSLAGGDQRMHHLYRIGRAESARGAKSRDGKGSTV